MANSKQAAKRARQSETRRQRNAANRSKMRTVIKNVLKAVSGGEKTAAESAYKVAVPIIDTMVNKNIIHKNKAARHKSRLNSHIQAM